MNNPAPGRLRKKVHEFEVTLYYTARSCLKQRLEMKLS
jgi:hypothetical protein